MTPHWHSITCCTCGVVLATGVFPPESEAIDSALEIVIAGHRQEGRCSAAHVVLLPASEEEIPRLLYEARPRRGTP